MCLYPTLQFATCLRNYLGRRVGGETTCLKTPMRTVTFFVRVQFTDTLRGMWGVREVEFMTQKRKEITSTLFSDETVLPRRDTFCLEQLLFAQTQTSVPTVGACCCCCCY